MSTSFKLLLSILQLAKNISKKYIKVFYKMGFLVISKIVYYMLKNNKKVVFEIFYNRVYNKRFFHFI